MRDENETGSGPLHWADRVAQEVRRTPLSFVVKQVGRSGSPLPGMLEGPRLLKVCAAAPGGAGRAICRSGGTLWRPKRGEAKANTGSD